MKLVKVGPKLRWVDKSKAEWIVQLTFDNGTQVEVDDFKTIRSLASCTRHWVDSDLSGASFLPRIEGQELEEHLKKRKHESRDEEK